MDFIKGNADVFEKILSYLSVKDILNCNLVCKAWYTQTNVNFIWKRFCEEEDIDPEEWDWDITDGDEWLLDTPCEWKHYFLNKQKTVFNWRNNICKVEQFKYIRASINTAYDGKTLVVRDAEHLRVYNIKKNDIKFLQLLQYNQSYCFTTNTHYIVVEDDNFIVVYSLEGDHYELVYSIKKITKKHCSCEIEDIVILGDISYLIYYIGRNCWRFFPSLQEVTWIDFFPKDPYYEIDLWNLKEKRQLLHLTDIECYNYDNKCLYIIHRLKSLTVDDSRYRITVYNKKGEVYYAINTKFYIDKVFINRHLLIGLHKVEPLPEMIAWDKHSGQEVIPCQKLNFDAQDEIYFPPKSDIIITFNRTTRTRTGYQLHNIKKLWVLHEDICSGGNFLFDYDMIDGMMLKYNSNSGSELDFDTIQVYNAYSSKYLYSIKIGKEYDVFNGKFELSRPLYVYKDLMIYHNRNEGNESLIIRIYR